MSNTAAGVAALLNNTSGSTNTAIGVFALGNNSEGSLNTAVGDNALGANTTAGQNTAIGALALNDSTTGDHNTAVGVNALTDDTMGSFNTAVGHQALNNNETGNLNSALGAGVGASVETASNVTCLGANASGADVSNTTWIANVFGITTISGNTMPVIVSSAGQLDTMSSSRRFKNEIKPMDRTSESILALNPVTFHYKSDSTNTPQFGLIAEEVAEVNPDLVVRNENGEIYTVRYDAINAMLLNEFLKEHKKVEELEGIVAALAATVKEQAARIQKVSAQIEMTDGAPQIVARK